MKARWFGDWMEGERRKDPERLERRLAKAREEYRQWLHERKGTEVRFEIWDEGSGKFRVKTLRWE